MKWLGIEWDESVDVGGNYGPYRQSERGEIYAPYIQQLLDNNAAYRCYMTSEELEAEREDQLKNGQTPMYGGKHANLTAEQEEQFKAEGREPAIRLRVPKDKTYTFNDMVKGDVSFDSNGFGDI